MIRSDFYRYILILDFSQYLSLPTFSLKATKFFLRLSQHFLPMIITIIRRPYRLLLRSSRRRAHKLLVSDFSSQTKGSRFESSHHLFEEVSSLQRSPGWFLILREVGGSGREELELAFPFPQCPLSRKCQVKENADQREFKKISIHFSISSICSNHLYIAGFKISGF